MLVESRIMTMELFVGALLLNQAHQFPMALKFMRLLLGITSLVGFLLRDLYPLFVGVLDFLLLSLWLSHLDCANQHLVLQVFMNLLMRMALVNLLTLVFVCLAVMVVLLKCIKKMNVY